MSWDFENIQDKKEYGISGSVTISAMEYRDLIAGVCQREHDNWYGEYQRTLWLEKKCNALEKELSQIKDWFDFDNDAKTKFDAWVSNQVARTGSEGE